MTNQNSNTKAAATASRKLITTSPDGKWETYLQYAGLMRYVPSGQFFARFKVAGKIKRESLETDVKTTAIDRLALKRKEFQKPKAEVGTFADGRLKFNAATDTRRDLADTSREYRHRCVACILKSWPGLDARRADSITESEMQKWAKEFADKYAAPFCNGSLNVFREILSLAGLKHDDNPAYKVDRLGVPQKELTLPTADEFEKVLDAMRRSGAATCKSNADLAKFLALSGCRKSEAWGVTWADVNFAKNELRVTCAKRRSASQERRVRYVPLVPALRVMLTELKASLNPKDTDPVCRVKTCDEALTAACKKVGCHRLTHHDLRHLFATFCIEAGADIPTLSRWLGHSDGGALALKTYGHLRREHSQAMAAKITFGLPAQMLGTADKLTPVEAPKQLTEASVTV